MFLKKENLYHPFTNSSIGFFVMDGKSGNDDYQFVLENFDLFYQPTEHPIFALVLLVMRILIGSTGVYVNWKLYRMVKKENGLVNGVTQIYCLSSIVIGPIVLLFKTSTDFVHPLNEVIGQWYCSFGRLTGYFVFQVIIFHSLVVALMRYCFIVHEERVRQIGKNKTKKFFACLSIFIPVLFVTWRVLENAELDGFHFLNRCYGIDHKVFLAEASPKTLVFCVFESSQTTSMYDKILRITREATCKFKAVLVLFMGGNFSEAFIYYKTISHIQR